MLLINMQSEIPWERKCKTCNSIFHNKRSCLEHLQLNKHHTLETTKEANDRLFNVLATNFTTALQKSIPEAHSSNITPQTPRSIKPSTSKVGETSPSRRKKKFIFTSANTVPSSIYKDNSNFMPDLVFISDSLESFDPIYGPEIKETPNKPNATSSSSPSSTSTSPASVFRATPDDPAFLRQVNHPLQPQLLQQPLQPQDFYYFNQQQQQQQQSSQGMAHSSLELQHIPSASLQFQHRRKSNTTRPNTGSSVGTTSSTRPNTGRSISSMMIAEDTYYSNKSYSPISQPQAYMQPSYGQPIATAPSIYDKAPSISRINYTPASQQLPSLEHPQKFNPVFGRGTLRQDCKRQSSTEANKDTSSDNGNASQPLKLPSIRHLLNDPDFNVYEYSSDENASDYKKKKYSTY